MDRVARWNERCARFRGNHHEHGLAPVLSPAGKDVSAATTSWPVGAKPNMEYELSGWIQGDALYGKGYGVVTLYEDDGDWGSRRSTDISFLDETSGWKLFRKRITTLPTTKRFFINLGLFQTYGTLWIDGIELVQVDSRAAQSPSLAPPCRRYPAFW